MGQQAGNTERDATGKIIGSRDLTEKQLAFARNYISNGGRQTEAAREAGYANPTVEGWRLLRNPAVQAFVFAERDREIGNIATIALKKAREIIENDAAPAGTRADLIKFFINQAGHVAPKAGGGTEGDKENKALTDMSADELEDFIRRGREAMANADKPRIDGEAERVDDAKPALPAPDGAPHDGEPTVIIDV